MCGIFGYIGKLNIDVKSAVDEIIHRGPDGEGLFTYDIRNEIKYNYQEQLNEGTDRVYLGFRRLAIIDISSESDQPFSRLDLGLTIVFNGEIYNYIELREELILKGYSFNTVSDTEVLLCAFHCWGESCLDKFNGMWAFSILDVVNRRLFCSRDRFGVKPFYYFQDKNQIIFGSEIKQFFKVGVNRVINENVLWDFLDKSLVDHTNETFFKDIYALKGGEYFFIDVDNYEINIEPVRWYTLKTKVSKSSDIKDSKLNFLKILEDSIKLRFRSDVSVGSCLSGGLDSSSIVSFAAKIFDQKDILVYNAKFNEFEFDESYYANLVIEKYRNTHIHFCSLTPSQIISQLQKVIYHQDEPFADFGILSQWEVMKLAKFNKTTVLLDGQGGDEILAGYRKYYAFYLKELFNDGKYFSFLKELFYLLKNRSFNFFDMEGIKRYLKTNSYNPGINRKKLLKPFNSQITFSSCRNIIEKSISDFDNFSIPALLRYEDRNSMAFSIEARVPMLDYRLVEYAISLPSKLKINNGFTKAILRDSMLGILPEKIRLRISKLGFSTPQSVWLHKDPDLNNYFRDYFKNMKNPYLNNEFIYNDFKNYPKSKLTSTEFSKYLIFDLWYTMNFNKLK
jgi:asparagine synthase (glutamine-hydrolysing)